MRRPSLPPGIYFRSLLIGYLEGIDSERGIAWRAADSLALHDFLGVALDKEPPDHSTISRTRRLIAPESTEPMKMKDGRTHLAHKAEHAVDLETVAIVTRSTPARGRPRTGARRRADASPVITSFRVEHRWAVREPGTREPSSCRRSPDTRLAALGISRFERVYWRAGTALRNCCVNTTGDWEQAIPCPVDDWWSGVPA